MFPDVSAWFSRFIVRLQTPRRLTSSAVRMAYAVAVFTDLAQLLLGLHPFLLPTFVLEFVPFTDMLPTWTACVALVIRSRSRQGLVVDEPPGSTPVIDVKA